MTEATPLITQKGDVPLYNATSTIEDDIHIESREDELSVYEAESEISTLEIVTALFSEWRRNGANEDLTSQDIMAMHIQYSRITHGREMLHAHHAIMNELTDVMVYCLQQVHFYGSDPYKAERRRKILRNLEENWPSIIKFDENLERNMNVCNSPSYQERIQNAWINCQRKYTVLQSSASDFTCQVLLSIILLSWPLSVMIMGAKFSSQCPMNDFLPDVMVGVGVVGIVALLLRLVLASIEKWCWFPMRSVMTRLWTALKILESVFLIALAIQLWFFFKDSPSFESEDPKFCDETFYTFTYWMNHVSSAFAVVWLVAYFVKAILWITRIRYHYMPPFNNYSEM